MQVQLSPRRRLILLASLILVLSLLATGMALYQILSLYGHTPSTAAARERLFWLGLLLPVPLLGLLVGIRRLVLELHRWRHQLREAAGLAEALAETLTDGSRQPDHAGRSCNELNRLHSALDVLQQRVCSLLRAHECAVEEQLRLAGVDPLTGLLNRRAWLHAGGMRLARDEHQFSVLVLGIDRFDLLSHELELALIDGLLGSVAGLCSQVLPSSALVARADGAQFWLLVEGCTPLRVQQLAERLRQTVLVEPWCGRERQALRISASLGVVAALPSVALEALVRSAVQAMEAAGANGGNRVVTVAHESVLPRQRCMPAAEVMLQE